MIISKSNFAADATVTISPESPIQDVNVIVDGDYSSVYSDALATKTTITLDFGVFRNVQYIAIGGSNITTKDRIVIRSNATDGLLTADGERIVDSGGNPLILPALSTIDDDTLGLSESRVLMYKLQSTEVSDIVIEIYGTGQLKIAEIAVGEAYEVPRGGYQAGYPAPWSVPNVKNRSATNLQNAPINHSYESRSINGALVIDNLIDTEQAEWDEMVTFCSYNTFYVLDDDDKYHSYAAFNADIKPLQADARTRRLTKAQMTYNAYARENEVIF